MASSSTQVAPPAGATAGGTFKVPKPKNNRTSWFNAPSFKSSSSSSSALSASSGSTSGTASVFGTPSAGSSGGSKASPNNPFRASAFPTANPVPSSNLFRSPFPSSKGKHKLSPSPSPRQAEEDFVMISPVKPPQLSLSHVGTPTSSSFFSTHPHLSMAMAREDSSSSSSPPEESPTPCVATAAARLKLADDDSPIRRVPGQSRSLKAGPAPGFGDRRPPASPLKFSTTNLRDEDMDEDDIPMPETPLMPNCPQPPPQPLFPLRTSLSQESNASVFSTAAQNAENSRIPRLSTSHPIRARSATDATKTQPMLSQKKAASLGEIQAVSQKDEPFGSGSSIPFSMSVPKKSRPGSIAFGPVVANSVHRAHKRHNSGEQTTLASAASGSISRSFGQKYGLALSLSPGLGHVPEFSTSNSSISTISTAITPPPSAFSPAGPPIFEDVKPLQEVFAASSGTVGRKFKPRDSGVAMDEDPTVKPSAFKQPPPSMLRVNTRPPRRPAMLKRTSSMGDERQQEVETPSVAPSTQSGWPEAFDFLGGAAASINLGSQQDKVSMPGTPVKKSAYAMGGRVGHSRSQPSLSTEADMAPLMETTRHNIPSPMAVRVVPPSTKKPPMSAFKPHLALKSDSSPESGGEGSDPVSPTARLVPPQPAFGSKPPVSRVGMLRRLSSGNGSATELSEDEATPTKRGGDTLTLAAARSANLTTPTHPPKPKSAFHRPSASHGGQGIMPRMSLPAFAAPKVHRALHHRQSHPATSAQIEDEDIFEQRFITIETLGKGAFSTVIKVQDRHGDGLWAVKKARGVFDGVKDRLRHLEEVDILRHLSTRPSEHVIRFESAWEQNRQLFIQTELCLGSLAFFLEEYGQVVERLDEARVWKIVRELSDGVNHIHSNGVIHFDLKPANILISPSGSLKIADFGLATRWPRLSPAEVLAGSGLGGSVAGMGSPEKLEREGDRVYMAPEMLRGRYEMAADVFSFGLVVLEVSTNICVPDGGEPWHALRSDDFSVVDLSPLSPALTDLITQCMRSEPSMRPAISHVVSHPVVQRARSGGTALAPEEPMWLVDVLSGSGFTATPTPSSMTVVGDGDIEMLDD